MSPSHEPIVVVDPDDDDAEFDHLAELFLTTTADKDIVIHHPDCDEMNTEHMPCSCVPITLKRGAKA